MNCCNEYGHCTQGSNCASRKTHSSSLSAGAVHAEWRDSQVFIIPEERTAERYSFTPSDSAPEAGNVWFAEPEPKEQIQLTVKEATIFYGSIVILSIVSLVCIAAGAVQAYRFAMSFFGVVP